MKSKRKKDEILNIKEILLDFLYPPRCPICDGLLKSSKERCCKKCRPKLPWVKGPVCMKCGKPVSNPEQEFCSDCLRTEHYFDQGAAAFTYSGGIRRSLYRMKFGNRRDYLDFYADAMTAACRKYLQQWDPDVIAAVPMHRSRRRKRGYNQAELLAKKISLRTGIPFERKLLRCIRKAGEQKTLNRKERLSNLYGCYEVTREIPRGMSVLIVDDVYTTGSTMDEIGRILKKSGAASIYFVVLCTGKGKMTVCTEEKL